MLRQKRSDTKPAAKKAESARKPGESLTPAQRLQMQDAFIAAYAEKGTILSACRAVGIHRSTFYDWTEKEETFDLRFQQARAMYEDVIRDEIHRRAVEGWDEDVYQLAKHAGTVHKYSDTLLIFHAKAKMSEYREKTQVDVTANVTTASMQPSELRLLTDEQLEMYESWLLAAKARLEHSRHLPPETKK